jgi:predicted PurR-regulated permease PerM
MLKLAGSTVRNVSRGVVGVALVQSFLAGLGFLATGVPAAGLLSFIALVLAIIQIGPAVLFIPIVVWSWTAMETADALIFTAYMVPVSLVDNVLRPLLMARGLTTPMPVILIGVIGGTGIRNQRPVSRPSRAFGRLGAFGGLGERRQPRRE